MTNEPADHGGGDDLARHLSDRLQQRASAAPIPSDGRARISKRVDQRRRHATYRNAGLGGAAITLLAVVVLGASLVRPEESQDVLTDSLSGSTSSVTTTSLPALTVGPDTTPPGTTPGSSTTAVATTQTTAPSVPPTTASPPTHILDFDAPGLPWLVIEDGRVLSSRTGAAGELAGVSAGWVSDDWQVTVIRRFTDAVLMFESFEPDDTMRAIGGGRYLKVTPENDGWSVLVYEPVTGGTGYTTTASDGGFHVSGTDADLAADLVTGVMADESDIPATLQAGTRTLRLVTPASRSAYIGEGEGWALTYQGPVVGSSIEVAVERAGQFGWRGEAVRVLCFGGPTNVTSAMIGGRSAWVTDVATADGSPSSAIIWEPNGEAVVVIHASGIDAASLVPMVQNRLHRVDEATWRELVALTAP